MEEEKIHSQESPPLRHTHQVSIESLLLGRFPFNFPRLSIQSIWVGRGHTLLA